MKSALRLVTVLCYFLPFTFFVVTCSSPVDLMFSYNQKEADENSSLAKSYQQTEEENRLRKDSDPEALAYSEDSEGNQQTQPNSESDFALAELQKNGGLPPTDPTKSSQPDDDFWEEIGFRALIPTTGSLSGIGSIFYFKNLAGQILLTLSLLISIFCLIAFEFLRSSHLQKRLLFSNILLLTIFMFVSIASDVTLRWGIIVLLLLLIFQWSIEVKREYNTELFIK